MKKFGEFICKNKKIVIFISAVLLVLSVIGMNLTKINYDILVYLPEDIETIKGQNILTDDFDMGAYSIAIIENMNSKDILKLEEKIKTISGVNEVVSLYDVLGTTIPLEMLPAQVTEHLHKDNTDLLFITFGGSTSSEVTIDAVRDIREVTKDSVKLGGMSSMVLDTMELSEKEILIYIVIAVICCILVLEFALDSYLVPIILLLNIGCAILFNLGSNIFLGQISYITKALVAVLQLGVTTDFSIFLYHSYEKKKGLYKTKDEAMTEAIKETFTSVVGSSLTTIAGFLVLCTMQLTLGADLGIVMAKGVLLGVVSVLTLFPSLLLVFDKLIEKTKHKVIVPKFEGLNNFVVKHNKAIFVLFLILLIPAYLAYSKVEVYYKIDKTLPDTLESITANQYLKDNYNIVSPEIILIDKNILNDDVLKLTTELRDIDGIDFVLSFSKIKEMGITEEILDPELVSMFENDKYQMLLLNSLYDVASDELNEQIAVVNDCVKKYDENAIVAGEGPLMKDLIEISDTDFNNVNYSSIICIFVILFIVLKSISLPFLLIITIEFAIFMNMGISYLGGTILPFVAPIVLGTIQLGATIDYAILMTTTYLNKRKNGITPNEAMIKTLNYSGNSIFVSAMCFFAATFGVGIYSDLEMVGSLCTLISRGAIISMLVVIMVLPAVLLIFDKLIMKTTMINRKDENMKNKIKKIGKKLTTWILLLSLLIASGPLNVLALAKNETVYTKINYDGSVKSIHVNEKLMNVSKKDTLEDYSELENILNISNNSSFTRDGNNITWMAQGNDILYQGTIKKDLPIDIDITYKLDGEVMNIDDMLGKEGKVTITLKYKNNDKHVVKVNGKSTTLYTPFIVTLGTIIDDELNSNVVITNGKVVNNGTKNVLVGIASPGLYESLGLSELKGLDTITISYDTKKFELGTIYFVVTLGVIDSDDLKIFDQIDSIYKSADMLQENMNVIENGTKDLAKGSNELKSSLGSAIGLISSNNAPALSDEQINLIKNQTIDNVNSMFTSDYKKSIADKAWEEVSLNLNSNDEKAYKVASDAATSAVVDYLNSVSEYQDYLNCETGKEKIKAGLQMNEEEQNSCGVIASDKTLEYVIKAAGLSANNAATNISSYVAENVAKQVAVNVALESAIATAGNVATTLAPSVANEVKNASLTTVSASLNKLYVGVSELDAGIKILEDGIVTYNAEGISKITNLINNNVKDINEKVKALCRLGNNYQSFANKPQEITGNTKFILVVQGKHIPQKEVVVEKEKTQSTFWDRVKNLFS